MKKVYVYLLDDMAECEIGYILQAFSMEKLLKIEGMSCNHCVNHVKEALEGLEGVKEASVSLEKNQARVILDKEVSEKSLKDVVKKAGYELTSIK